MGGTTHKQIIQHTEKLNLDDKIKKDGYIDTYYIGNMKKATSRIEEVDMAKAKKETAQQQ